jgi:hypothetical protein
MATLGSVALHIAERVRAVIAAKTVASGPQALPVRRIVAQAVVLWLVSRALLMLLWWAALAFGLALPNRQTGPLSAEVTNAHGSLLPWLHWDAVWYVTIATRGYDFQSQLAPGGAASRSTGLLPTLPALDS